MTIQVSVTVWTVICFTALYFILKYLLFSPMLELMDKRKAKIERSNAERRAAEMRFEEEKRKAEAENAERAAEKERLMKEAAENIRKEGKERLEAAKKQRLSTLLACRTNADKTLGMELAAADGEVEKAASLLIRQVTGD